MDDRKKIMLQIIWYPHARERLVERGIDIKLVQSAIERPDQIVSAGKQKIIHKRYRDPHRRKEYLLRIFIDERAGGRAIRSVYRTSKISKYWRDEL